ncbi:Clc-like protein 2 [Toxocara canis]|uniref:Clc-like protein 2 n=1 Tax=Toxocara canis TaxID=6265 RepID=A0A0B2V7N8_TOXCA|nr:Clc-like protein 2 [Toxocara canis]
MFNPKTALQVPAFVLTFIAVIINFIALATPSWQVNIDEEHSNKWQHDLLYIILSAQMFALFALISFCVSQAESAHKSATKFFCAVVGISVLINLAASVAFQIFAHMVEYRFYHVSVSGIYEKHVGYSYYLHLTGSLMLLLAFVFSLCYVIADYRLDTSVMRNQQTFTPYQPFGHLDPLKSVVNSVGAVISTVLEPGDLIIGACRLFALGASQFIGVQIVFLLLALS